MTTQSTLTSNLLYFYDSGGPSISLIPGILTEMGAFLECVWRILRVLLGIQVHSESAPVRSLGCGL